MFRRKYRDVEALLLDDQFFAESDRRAEVRHTIDNIRAGSRLLSLDRRSAIFRNWERNYSADFAVDWLLPCFRSTLVFG